MESSILDCLSRRNGLSYTWVKAALQGAGLVARGRKRGVHRKPRPRRPLPGMLLHIDGSRHRWFQDERWHDLIVLLDDASSEIYYPVEGAGRLIPQEELQRCFGCHTTASTTDNRVNPRDVIAGVSCEHCHGPGAAHVATAKAGKYKVAAASIFNPAQLNPVDSVDFCGACHRTRQDVLLDSPTKIGRLNVRFAPYRLENSRCWLAGKGDARLTCITCHDPHQPLEEDPAAYDSKCLGCHVATGVKQSSDDHRTACPTGVKLCVTCHMPKFTNPGFHFTFTDHGPQQTASLGPVLVC